MVARPLRLGINIDHVATLRNARDGGEPNPIRAALLAQEAGADGITAHLREDRRHIRDMDMELLKKSISIPLNFEMAATREMVEIAISVQPHACCLVPEKREERTTEGGLNVIHPDIFLKEAIQKLSAAGIRVSLFVEPDPHVLDACKALGAPVVELHTGTYCEAPVEKRQAELERIKIAAAYADEIGLECHAGHGLNYETAQEISAIPTIAELNIGHFLIGEAVFVGLKNAIQTMRSYMNKGRGIV